MFPCGLYMFQRCGADMAFCSDILKTFNFSIIGSIWYVCLVSEENGHFRSMEMSWNNVCSVEMSANYNIDEWWVGNTIRIEHIADCDPVTPGQCAMAEHTLILLRP